MPFASDKQRRYLFANLPRLAGKWAAKYGSGDDDQGGDCGRVGRAAGGRVVWAICDRGRWAAGARRWGWWVRNEQTMAMRTGSTRTREAARAKTHDAIKGLS